MRGTVARRDPPRDQGFTSGLWTEGFWEGRESARADRRAAEKSIEADGTVLWVFSGNPTPDGRAADPRRTPFFVRCAGRKQPEVA